MSIQVPHWILPKANRGRFQDGSWVSCGFSDEELIAVSSQVVVRFAKSHPASRRLKNTRFEPALRPRTRTRRSVFSAIIAPELDMVVRQPAWLRRFSYALSRTVSEAAESSYTASP